MILPALVSLILMALSGTPDASAACDCKKTEAAAIPQASLAEAAFTDLPYWADDDPARALATLQRSCVGILEDAGRFSDARFGAAGDWLAVCRLASRTDAAQARAFFERNFKVMAVSGAEGGPGKVTGYYEPELEGSRFAAEGFTEPAYARPNDLITVDAQGFAAILKGERLAGKVAEGRLVPYETRTEIRAPSYQGRAHPLLYLRAAADLFFLQVQGSGRVKLTDGSAVRLTYAAQNGHPYTAIGAELIRRGEIAREAMSMQAIRAWLDAHPGEAEALMNLNASYVFFREEALPDPTIGPPGAEKVALTPGRSMAVDARVYPYGLPVYVSAEVAGADGKGREPFNHLMIAQDTGGAIRGVVRGDIFFGWGAEAEHRASATNGQARFWVLVPKNPAP